MALLSIKMKYDLFTHKKLSSSTSNEGCVSFGTETESVFQRQTKDHIGGKSNALPNERKGFFLD